MIYLFAAYVVGSLAVILYCVRTMFLSQRDHNMHLQAMQTAGDQARHQLQTQLLAMVADPQTAVTVAMGQELEEVIKPVHYMDDAAMADYEEKHERAASSM